MCMGREKSGTDVLFVGCDNLLQLLDIGASQVRHLLLVLDEDEGRHGCNLETKDIEAGSLHFHF